MPGAAHAHVEERRAADGRVPEGFLMVVTGQHSGRLAASRRPARVLGRADGVMREWAEMHDDLVVLTGLRAGAEEMGAATAAAAGVPYVVVLPYPDPTAGWPERERARFEAACAAARSVVTLEKQRPADVEGRREAALTPARRAGCARCPMPRSCSPTATTPRPRWPCTASSRRSVSRCGASICPAD